jgi:hypothetical protein
LPVLPVQDIGREFWEQQGKRERRERLVSVNGHAVLRMNMYDINQVRRYMGGTCAVHAVYMQYRRH